MIDNSNLYIEKSKIKFGVLRKLYDRTARVSMCMRENLNYENFELMKDVPESYNDYWVVGFGPIESEFRNSITKELDFLTCTEFMLEK